LNDLKQRSRWILASLEHNRPKQKLPQYVFILRDGLSEGQYEMVKYYFDNLFICF